MSPRTLPLLLALLFTACTAPPAPAAQKASTRQALVIPTRNWSAIAHPTMPNFRPAALGYDADRAVAVAVGVTPWEGDFKPETWEWDGATWKPVTAADQPDWESVAAVYDAARHRLLVYGGCDAGYSGGSYHACAWESAATRTWDGSTWVKHGGTQPPNRVDFALGYHAGAQTAVLFGGRRCADQDPLYDWVSWVCTTLGDTWLWDGSSWRAGGSGPSARFGAQMAYDSVDSRLVLLGSGETWTWSAAPGWGKLNVSGPSAAAAALFTGADGRVLMLGNDGSTWRFSGSSWTALATPLISAVPKATVPTDLPVTFDRGRGRALMLDVGLHWEWDASAWRAVHPAGPARLLYKDYGNITGTTPLAADPELGEIAVFSYHERLGSLVWVWSVGTWTRHGPMVGPDTRKMSHAAYDAAGHRTLVVRAWDPGAPLETWAWQDQKLTKLSGQSPPHMWEFGMGSDPRRRMIVVAGYRDGETPTWEWNGTGWHERAFAEGLSYESFRLPGVYDPLAGMVLFDGGKGWDGARWRNVESPPIGARVSFDHSLGRRVALEQTTRELVGGTWIDMHPAVQPADSNSVFEFDYSTGHLLAFGVQRNDPMLSVWRYDALGAKCQDGADCFTGACVDGVCCEASSCADCQACNRSAAPGRCTPVVGLPDLPSCAGVCTESGECVTGLGQSCANDAECESGACVDGVCCTSAECGVCQRCNATGACAAVSNEPDPDTCHDESTCDEQGKCKLDDGQTCSFASQCASGACVADQCCPAGGCQKDLGERCTQSSECRTNHCVDGVCCNTACSDSCEACGADGVCNPVEKDSQPVGDRKACAAASEECAGRCDGESSACVYRGAETVCESACEGRVLARSLCDGRGACATVTPEVCPGSLRCDGAGELCLTRCENANDCARGAVCNPQTGQCAGVANRCIDDVRVQLSEGTSVSCAPYACRQGSCAARCTSPADCASGATCSNGACTGGAETAGRVTGDTSCAAARSGAETRTNALWLMGLGLCLLRRRVGRRAVVRGRR